MRIYGESRRDLGYIEAIIDHAGGGRVESIIDHPDIGNHGVCEFTVHLNSDAGMDEFLSLSSRMGFHS